MKSKPKSKSKILTSREREIWRLLALGNSNPAAARILNLAPTTINVHRANIMRKLGTKNATDLTREAVRQGIIAIKVLPTPT